MTTSFYPPYHLGGDATHVKYLAEALVKEGHEVHVLFSMDAYNLKRKNKSEVKTWNGVKIHILKSPLGKLEPIMNYCFGTQRYTYNYFKKLVKKEKFDVVHHHNISLLGHKILKKIGNYKNLYTAHDYWLTCPKYDRFKFGKICEERKNCFFCCLAHKHPYPIWWNSKDFKCVLNDIDTIIAPSEYMAKNLRNYINKEVKVIYNFVPEPKNVKSQKKYKDYFIFVGQLERHKGILPLIEVFKELKDKKLLAVGTGSLEKEIKDKVRNYKNIKLLGWKSQEELFPLVKDANALMLPSLWGENMPLTIIESYSLGSPAIGTNLGGVPELIEKVDKNLIFDYRDFLSLKGIIENFYKKTYTEKKIKDIYEKSFSSEGYLKKYGELIK